MITEQDHIRNAVIVSDLHCGCRLALCPPEPIPIDQGGTYQASELQLKLWEWWLDFWDNWVPMATRGEPFAVIINGDTTDGRHHGSVTQVSQNLVDQRRIALAVLRPIIKRCAVVDGIPQFYMTRGTEAHVGASGENEETLAEELGAIPNSQGDRARYELWLRLGGDKGCLSHIMHHIGTTGRTHYETSALMGEFGESCAEAGRWRLPPPDVVVRSHRHRHSEIKVPTANGDGICTVTPGWQLKTPFVYKIPGGRVSTPQCGGILIRQGDEEHYTRHKIYNVSRPSEVVL
jgi:hypothetical protein